MPQIGADPPLVGQTRFGRRWQCKSPRPPPPQRAEGQNRLGLQQNTCMVNSPIRFMRYP